MDDKEDSNGLRRSIFEVDTTDVTLEGNYTMCLYETEIDSLSNRYSRYIKLEIVNPDCTEGIEWAGLNENAHDFPDDYTYYIGKDDLVIEFEGFSIGNCYFDNYLTPHGTQYDDLFTFIPAVLLKQEPYEKYWFISPATLTFSTTNITWDEVYELDFTYGLYNPTYDANIPFTF